MGKRRHFEQLNRKEKNYNVEPLYGRNSPWDPLNSPAFDRRDQSYVRKVKPQNANQSLLLGAMAENSLVVALGPAGTGKTYLAITAAVEALEAGKVDRIILSRPAIEAGETLGFLPGDLQEKMSPFLRPLYDALNDRMGGKRLKQLLAEGSIEIAPIGFMRGRTLNNAFVVIDDGFDGRSRSKRFAGRFVGADGHRAQAGSRHGRFGRAPDGPRHRAASARREYAGGVVISV